MSVRWGVICGVLLFFGFLGFSAAELRFEPMPRLLETFHIVVRGVPAEKGEAVLFNAATGQRLVVPLERPKDKDLLKSPPIQVVRACDERKASYAVEVRGPGDLLVAATELACGLSAAARAHPRAGEPELFLEIKEGEEWKPIKALGAGEYRIRVVYAPADRTCERDPLPHGLKIRAGIKEISLELQEDAPTSGSFSWGFSVAFELDREARRLFLVLTEREKRVLEVPAECARVVFSAVEKHLEAPVQLLPVEVQPATALLVPVGCRAKLWVAKPEKPDEVWWWVPGRGWLPGLSFELLAEEPLAPGMPRYPEALLAKIFVRKGAAWGTVQTALSFVPRPKLLFLDAKTGDVVVEPWPADKELKLRVVDLVGVPKETLRANVGKLGLHPMERVVELYLVEEGVYESKPLSPKAWQAKAGDYLWVQFHYPEPIECVISVLLLLR